MSVWRLVVKDATNVAVATYGPGAVDGDGGIVGFPSFDVDPSGNCVSLAFDAVSKRNLITSRSIIEVQRYDGSNWVAWWLGMVTTVGTTRSDRVQRYTALGLKQYFYERVLDTPRWPEQPDVSTDAANLPEFTELNAQVYGVTRDGTSAPTLDFSIGVTLPYRQFMGEFLDQRANQVGAFIVPSGEYYDYDGNTFYAGDTVPAVKWGVNADGLFFFRRSAASQVQVDEADPEIEVTWAPKSTEGKANTIDFTVIADVDRERLLAVKAQQAYSGPPGYFGGSWVSSEQTFVPLSARSPSSNPSYPVIERRFQATNPLDLMKRNAIAFNSNALWSNLANAVDSDPLTYATFGGTFTPITATGGTVTTVGDYTVHTFTSSGTFTVSAAGSNPDVEYLIVAGGGGGGTSNSGAASGGGAGGMKTGSTTVTATSYTITVGAGGNGAVFGTPITNATKGGNSSAFSVTAEGGGRGTQGLIDTGKSGGSGSGGVREQNTAGSSAGGSGNVGEGNDGGTATTVASAGARAAAGGGGGAGGAAPTAAATSSADAASAGGIGLESSLSGSAVTYATGGAGRVASGGGTSGAANTGNGGEGAIGGGNGGNGGSGIVIVRYRSVAPTYSRALGTPFDFSSPSVISTSSGGSGTGAYLVSYASDSPVAFAIKRAYPTITGTIDVPPSTGFTIQKNSEMFFEFPATNTDSEVRVQRVVIPALAPVGLLSNALGGNTFYVFGVNGLRIYDAAFYNIDSDVVTRVAEGLVQDPNSEAAIVDVQGFSPVATEVEITAIDSPSPIVMPVERIEYAITSNDGIVTRYYAGQRFDPELQTEATVIDAAIRRLAGSLETL